MTASFSISWLTVSEPPWTTLSTPAGIPAISANSTKRIVEDGACSEGFKTKQLPQAIAGGNIKAGSMSGKLNAVIPTPTPRGLFKVYVSTSDATLLAISPSCKRVIEQAFSMASSARPTSPSASANVLPCSKVTNSANSWLCSRTRC